MIKVQNFERMVNDKQVKLITIKNASGLEATICNYGARIIELVYNGVNVTPAYPSLDDYIDSTIAPYHGATVGRYANRIANGRFELDGHTYSLPLNNLPNHLHGGPQGFHAQVWEIEQISEESVTLFYLSKDGEEGYPGEVKVWVTYSLTDADEWIIDYKAQTTEATPFNITNHAFFNLNGSSTILNHLLQINAGKYTPVTTSLIPTGIANVKETAFDFKELKKIGDDIDSDEEQIILGVGYDHNFVLNKTGNELSFAAKAIGDESGIVMDVFTTEPGMQLFSGNFEAVKGEPASYRTTFCLETQHFPDSPNQPDFPSTILRQGEIFSSKTIYKFSSY